MPRLRFAQRRALLVHELDRPGRLHLLARPRLAVALGCLIALALVGTALGLTGAFPSFPGGPKPTSDRVEVVRGSEGSLSAWASDNGICLDVTIGTGTATGCGLPVVGSPPDTAHPDAAPPSHQIAGLVTVDPSGHTAAIAGAVAPAVKSVQIELADATVVPAQVVRASSGLDTPLRFFYVEAPVDTSAPSPHRIVRAFRAYDAGGKLLERFVTP